MPPINLQAPVVTKDPDLYRVQQRLNVPIAQLASSPWGAGVELDNVPLNTSSAAGTQTLTVTHNLGKAATSVVVLHANIAVSNAFNVRATSQNACTFSITTQAAVPANTTLNLWVS